MKVKLTGKMTVLVASMTGMLDARMAFRLSIITAGMMLAGYRRVAASWFAAAGVQDDWDRFYDRLISVERKTQLLALPPLVAVVRKFAPDPEGHMIVAVDDSPTRRHGRHVEGAGVHHNPTAGPAGKIPGSADAENGRLNEPKRSRDAFRPGSVLWVS